MAEQPPLQSMIEDALELEELGVNLYRSCNALWVPIGSIGVFGGQVLGQALHACTRTVADPLVVHSLHSYFLLSGDPKLPILYHVERVRDGKSFSTRSVEARQRGMTIFVMTASFQRPVVAVGSLEHQVPAPHAPAPERLKNEEDRLKEWLKRPTLPKKYHEMIARRLQQPIPIEIRSVPIARDALRDPEQSIWIRANGKLGAEVKQNFHQAIIAYASDHVILTTALRPHGLTFPNTRLKMMATLDHSMWFHAPFKADEYLLYHMRSPRSGQNRGLVFGEIYQNGTLVASCAQEGIFRLRDDDNGGGGGGRGGGAKL